MSNRQTSTDGSLAQWGGVILGFLFLLGGIQQLLRGNLNLAGVFLIVAGGLYIVVKRSLDEETEAENSKLQLDYEPLGEYVTAEQVNKISEALDDGEQVMYILKGTQIDVEGSGSGSSFYGKDRSRKQGTKGWVRTAVTDKRIVSKVPQILGSDERSIPYRSITGVDLDRAAGLKRISVQTAGSTYHIEAGQPDMDECREATRYIREKISEANEPTVAKVPQETPETDPIEQIERLENLHDNGTISEDQFEDKKQELLDKL